MRACMQAIMQTVESFVWRNNSIDSIVAEDFRSMQCFCSSVNTHQPWHRSIERHDKIQHIIIRPLCKVLTVRSNLVSTVSYTTVIYGTVICIMFFRRWKRIPELHKLFCFPHPPLLSVLILPCFPCPLGSRFFPFPPSFAPKWLLRIQLYGHHGAFMSSVW